MSREAFEELRDLPNKIISQDIVFQPLRETSPNLTFEGIKVDNSLGWEVLLNGTYKPGQPAICFNFVAKGVGAFCRIEVNNTIHGDAGRTHKHDLKGPDCPRQGLRRAVARPDLEGKSPTEVWRILCRQANITHTGQFIDPSSSNA
jgi:hypothetical protein